MATVMTGLVEGIGIADTLPVHPVFFTEISVPETLEIPCQKPDMEQLLSVMVDAQVISLRIANTPVAISEEGQNLSGSKLIIELKLREKVKYVADEPTQSVHAAHFENVLKSVFVIVPSLIGTVPVAEYLRLNKITVTPYIEDIYAKMVDERTLFKNITILVDVIFRA